MESIQGEILNKTTELIKIYFADFLSQSLKKPPRQPQYASSKHHPNCDKNDKLKHYITTSSKTSGSS